MKQGLLAKILNQQWSSGKITFNGSRVVNFSTETVVKENLRKVILSIWLHRFLFHFFKLSEFLLSLNFTVKHDILEKRTSSPFASCTYITHSSIIFSYFLFPSKFTVPNATCSCTPHKYKRTSFIHVNEQKQCHLLTISRATWHRLLRH